MNSITCSRLVYSSLCELAGLTRYIVRDLSDINLNLKSLVPAMDTLEENQSLVMDGYNPYTSDHAPINGVDTSHNSSEPTRIWAIWTRLTSLTRLAGSWSRLSTARSTSPLW